MVLVQAGLGVAILPNVYVFHYHDIHHKFSKVQECPITDAGERSFGYYYKTLKGNAPLRDFIRLLKESLFSEVSESPAVRQP